MRISSGAWLFADAGNADTDVVGYGDVHDSEAGRVAGRFRDGGAWVDLATERLEFGHRLRVTHDLSAFTETTETETYRRWKAVKEVVSQRDLGGGLQPQLRAVKAFFEPRNKAAHGWVQIFTVAGTKQINRFSFNGWELRGETVTIADLQQELEDVQRGQEALQAVGRALDADHPGALPPRDPFVRLVVLGEEDLRSA